MKVRSVRGRERTWILYPRRFEWSGPRRLLDAGEQRQIVHLYRTRQQTMVQLAERFGVSIRTVVRYVHHYPEPSWIEPAARRVQIEAGRFGLALPRDHAERLALAALTEPYRTQAAIAEGQHRRDRRKVAS